MARAPTLSNFTAALNRHFREHCIVVTPSPGLSSYPVTIDDPTAMPAFEALVTVGLLRMHRPARADPDMSEPRAIQSSRVDFTLTAKGRADLHVDPDTGAGFCAGHYVVVSIDNRSMPARASGAMTADVTFTAEPRWEAWQGDPIVQDRFGAELAEVGGIQSRAVLRLTKHGWIVEDGSA